MIDHQGGRLCGGRRCRRGTFIGQLDRAAGALRRSADRAAPFLDALPRWVRALGTDNADAAAGQQLNQAGDIRLFARQSGEIEQHGAGIEERWGAGDLRIERCQPVRQRRLGRKHKRHERAATDSDGGTGLGS